MYAYADDFVLFHTSKNWKSLEGFPSQNMSTLSEYHVTLLRRLAGQDRVLLQKRYEEHPSPWCTQHLTTAHQSSVAVLILARSQCSERRHAHCHLLPASNTTVLFAIPSKCPTS